MSGWIDGWVGGVDGGGRELLNKGGGFLVRTFTRGVLGYLLVCTSIGGLGKMGRYILHVCINYIDMS